MTGDPAPAAHAAMLTVSDRWWTAVWRDGDVAAMADIFTDPMTRHTSSGSETLRIADYQRRIADTQRAFCCATTTVDDRSVDGDRVWTRATSRGINKETGEPSLVTWLIVQRFEADRIAEHWVATLAGIDWTA
ncbi:MAG: nuclear transport factor 2 family protein [Desertimonas sp.]